MWLRKPVPFTPFEIPKGDTWYKHLDEGVAGYEWATERLNFLSEMFKFFPEALVQKFTTQELTDKAKNKSGIFADDEMGIYKGNTPWDSTPGRGYEKDLFGALHSQRLGNKLWGIGEGSGLKESISYPNAGATNLIKNGNKSYNYSLADDPAIYAKRAFQAGFDTSRLGDYRPYIKEALSFLAGSGQSYYEIVMSGINDTQIPIIGGQKIDYNGIKWGNKYSYDKWTNKDAFNFIVGVTRSRRLVLTVMAELICPTYMIANKGQIGPDDAGIIKNFDSWREDPKRGKYLHANNLKTFGMFVGGMQHHLRGLNAALTGGVGYQDVIASGPDDSTYLGDLGYNGEMRGARETVAFKRFRSFIRSKATKYVSGLSGSKQANAQKILNEAFYLKDTSGSEIPQPWSSYIYGEKESDFVGWDVYSTKWDSKTTAAPKNVNPNAGILHPDYTISQITGLSHSQLVGRASVNGKNLYRDNWTVHVVGTFREAEQTSKQAMINTVAQNSVMGLDSQRKMNKYRDDKADAIVKEEEEELEKALSARAAAMIRAKSRAADLKAGARMEQQNRASANKNRAKKQYNKPKKQNKQKARRKS